MATENRIVNSANRIELQFDGKVVGLLQSVRSSEDYGLDAASGIGDVHVQEYVPTLARYQISVSTMVLFSKNLRDLGISPENADQVLKGMVFDIVIFGKDPKNSGVLKKYVNCSFNSGDSEVVKHAIVMSNAVFYALDTSGTKI